MKLLRLGLVVTGCLISIACITHQTAQSPKPALNLTAIDIKGESIQPVATSQLEGWLVTSESEGLYWLSAQGQTLGHWPGQIAQADLRMLSTSTEQVVIAALDSNTTALRVFTLNMKSGAFTEQLRLPSEIADRETLCLGRQHDDLYLFSTDAQGLLSHFLIDTSTPEQWQLVPVRELMVGPNLSACSVADDTHTLLITEEEVGVWHYNADSEGENTRTLDYFPTAPETESVSALTDQRYFTVATDEPLIRQRGEQNAELRVEPHMELKSVKVSSAGDSVYFGLYDEASDRLLTAQLQHQPVAKKAQRPLYTLTPDVETTPVNRYGDAADDPAIWVNESAPEHSLVLGTDKKYGLNVYALTGELLQTLPVGRVNNVDVRQQVPAYNGPTDIAVASNRSNQSISVFSISAQGDVSHTIDLPTTLSDIYGLCSGVIDQQLHVFVNDTNGTYQQYKLALDSITPTAQLVKTFTLPSQPEGCVIDDTTRQLYMGEEAMGIWQLDLTAALASPVLIATINDNVAADIEGMGIYQLDEQSYLVVSSQGNNRYAVYALNDNNRLLGTFAIGINPARHIDGVSETDGLEVTSVALGEDFPEGLLVVQDGRNVLPNAPQNFKLVSGKQLATFIRAYQ